MHQKQHWPNQGTHQLVTVVLLTAENQQIHLQKLDQDTTGVTTHLVVPELGCLVGFDHLDYERNLPGRNRRNWRIEETQKRTGYQAGRGFQAEAGKGGEV